MSDGITKANSALRRQDWATRREILDKILKPEPPEPLIQAMRDVLVTNLIRQIEAERRGE